MAQSKWVRVASNFGAQYYDVFVATARFSEPEWPDLDFRRILDVCFRNRVICDVKHIAVKRLRGEA